MAALDHLGITVADVPSASAQFHPVLTALGYTRAYDAPDHAYWRQDGQAEILLYPAREDEGDAPHRHGRVGWQHLAFAVDSREEVDRLHRIALDAGWSAVREPKEYPRFTARYYASFVEDDNGIRLEVLHNPPREGAAG
ncbi:VOC family protein [Microbacterium capsulatum]|uniref:VOC family protein n=1 Tax=Microbacterium capsulatum TaxID=3041921 RepID=A0ABU0XK96_9MICO|nr:VOC family protein [Microbacterium sp. ASV81]MDQ4215562.1 VOC family protein [Microbacterium sp. ASV81]